MSKDDLPVMVIFLTWDSKVERYLNPANYNKVLGTTLHPTVGSAVCDLSTTGHPRAFNQCTTSREVFASQYLSLKRMDDRMMYEYSSVSIK